jgi:hypothetical protein
MSAPVRPIPKFGWSPEIRVGSIVRLIEPVTFYIHDSFKGQELVVVTIEHGLVRVELLESKGPKKTQYALMDRLRLV